jgi:recombination protein RecT
VAKLKDGGNSFLVMSVEEMKEYRENHAKAKSYGKVVGPWVDEFDAMARKTVLRQLIKYLPISVENLSNFDETSGSEVVQELKNATIIDAGDYVPTMDLIPENVDPGTGEIK